MLSDEAAELESYSGSAAFLLLFFSLRSPVFHKVVAMHCPDYASNFLNASVTLCPPNPKELAKATFTVMSRDSLGT